MESFGWAGRILRVNLSTGRLSVEATQPYAEQMLGGRGIGQWILFHELDISTSPLGPENKLVLSAGVLVGTLAPGAGRLSVDWKNPQTGGVGSANAGGHFAPELKYAGFDAVVVEGVSEKPVVLFINDGKAEIMDASSVWGKTTWETEDFLRRKLRNEKLRVACIGPAGENLVLGACLVVDRNRAAGRGGLGAVLGAKKLKAIAVRGTRPVKVYDPENFIKQVKECWNKVAAVPTLDMLRINGTLGTSVPKHVRNGQFEEWSASKFENVRRPAWDKYEVSRMACFNCPVYCSHYYRISDGPFAGLASEGIEANTVRAFGSNLDIDYPPALLKLSSLSNQLGIDVDFAGAVLGWAFESYQRGLITTKDTGGYDLVWGNYNSAISLLEDVAYRRGIGNILADGVKRAAEATGAGSEEWALHIKGADINESGLRSDKAWALGISIANRGGGHLDGAPMLLRLNQPIPAKVSQKLWGIANVGPVNGYEHKEAIVFWQQRLKGAFDALGICYLLSQWVGLDALGTEDCAPLVEFATGIKISPEKLMLFGQRVHNVEKAFNTLHTDFNRKDDFPPLRFMREGVESGIFTGEVIHKNKWERLLDNYYIIQGWDSATGLQRKDTLLELGLESVAEKLTVHGKLK